MATQDDFIRTALRVPPDLHKLLHRAATTSNRTFNAEIIARLQSSFDEQASKAATHINELELELSKQRLHTFAERNKATQYSLALMQMAERLPPGAFADNPRVEEVLQDARDNRDAMTLEAMDHMLKDMKTLVADLHANVQAGRIKVVSEQERAESKRSKSIEVVVRGKKQILQVKQEIPEVQTKGKVILVGNIGRSPNIDYLAGRTTPPTLAETKAANKGPVKRVRNKPPK